MLFSHTATGQSRELAARASASRGTSPKPSNIALSLTDVSDTKEKTQPKEAAGTSKS